ncbi:MAG: ABC transporter substrate-binding protein [Candidatus Bathyarchaeia archaeon]|jgi:iron complex transport system substrate-binding protein
MNTKTIIIIIAAIAVVAVGIFGAINFLQPAEQQELENPITIVDGTGATVTIAEYPEKIISIAPSCTEILFAIGLEDKIVGLPTYDHYSPEIQAAIDSGKIATVGDFQTINIEAVVGLEPDLILSKAGFQLTTATKFRDDLNKTVVILTHSGFTGYLNDITLIGKITGQDEEATTFVESIQAQAQEIVDKTKDLPKPTVYVEYGGMNSYGNGSVVNELITMAGGVNVFGDYNGQYLTTSTEEVLKANPEIIIISSGVMSSYYACTPEEIASRQSWGTISAVINNQIYEVDENLITVAGPNIVDGLEALAQIFHPDAFSNA